MSDPDRHSPFANRDSKFVRVAARGDVGPGIIQPVEVSGERILLCNVEGELYAVRDECTHERFPLSAGLLDGHRLTCTLHGACFDVRNGEVLALPAMEAVRTYEVRVRGDDIEVAIAGEGGGRAENAGDPGAAERGGREQA